MIDVTLPRPRLLIRRTDQAFTIRDGGITLFRFDFRSKDWCPHGTTTCAIDADDVAVSVQ